MIALVEPVTAALFSVLLLDETLTAPQLIGMGMILFTVTGLGARRVSLTSVVHAGAGNAPDALCCASWPAPVRAKQGAPAMAVLAFCRDGGDKRVERETALEEHLAYIRTIDERIAVAGPWYPPGGEQAAGSCFVYHTDALAEAEALLFADPYYRAGVYDEVTLVPFRGVAGTWVGGLQLPPGA